MHTSLRQKLERVCKLGQTKLNKMKAYLESEEFNEDLSLQEILIKLQIDPDEYEEALTMSDCGNWVSLRLHVKFGFLCRFSYHLLPPKRAIPHPITIQNMRFKQ